MFFVFGPQGQVYRGGPENLARIGAVRRVQRPQALNTRTASSASYSDAAVAAVQGDVNAFGKGISDLAVPDATAGASTNHRMHEAAAAYHDAGQTTKKQRQLLTRVSDVMTAGAITVQAHDMVNHAWQTLATEGVSQAPVLNQAGQVVGLLLRADMAPLDLLPEPGAIHDAIALARRPVADVMLSPISTVDQETDLRRVAGVLLELDLPGLPVTDAAGALIGFLSRTDILRAVAADPPLDLWSGPAPHSKHPTPT